MRQIYYKADPFNKEGLTLALESGVDGVIVPSEQVESVSAMARLPIMDLAELTLISLEAKEDELEAAKLLQAGKTVVLNKGWEIIPVENLLAQEELSGHFGRLALEVRNLEEAELAIGILERGADCLVIGPEALGELKTIVDKLQNGGEQVALEEAEVLEIRLVGMGHRVCVDTLSMFQPGQGMLVGNSAAMTFLVNAETEHNEYVASRPFRVNAGSAHSYAVALNDSTCYLSELASGSEIMGVDHLGNCSRVVVGRAKVEKRPMLLITARCGERIGGVFLQNAETIRLVQPGGSSISVVALKAGDKILCHLDQAGRHFGMRINEDIKED